MRGTQRDQWLLFFEIDLEDRIRPNHPLRPIKKVVDAILKEMDPLFTSAYSKVGRPSTPPEILLKALLLQALYSVRSERALVERLDTDLLFRWFCGMHPADPIFHATDFTHNRKRMHEHGLTRYFFEAVVRHAIDKGVVSCDHFSVDGTLIESYASIKSIKPIPKEADDDSDHTTGQGGGDSNGFKSRNPEVDFRGQRRTNQTHRSTTDPDARLYRKGHGKPAIPAHMAHALSENRHGLMMRVCVTQANGKAECQAAIQMVDEFLATHGSQPKTLGADRGYDGGSFLLELERRGITPHVAMRNGPVGGLKQTTRLNTKNHPGLEARERMLERARTGACQASQKARRKVEEGFGWLKEVAGLACLRHTGYDKIQQLLEVGATAFNLVRLRTLEA